MEKYDLVKIVNAPHEECRHLIGEEGIIINVDERYGYPYEVVFFSKNAQKFSIDKGSLLWKEFHLEHI